MKLWASLVSFGGVLLKVRLVKLLRQIIVLKFSNDAALFNKMKILFALTLLFCISVAFGLKCNVCSSTTSMEDCDSNKEETDCGSANDRCIKTSLNFKVLSLETKTFVKSCTTKAICDNAEEAMKACKDASGECSIDCCEGDLCNGGSAPVVSILLMVSCASMAILR